MFRGHVCRSGSLRSVWHRRERKRRPRGPSPADVGTPPHPSTASRAPTEAEWQSGNPHTMIRCVARLATDRGIAFHLSPCAVERKLRLFYCACCRLFWDRLPDAGRAAVKAAERSAHGLANAQPLRAVRRAARAAERATWPLPQPGGYAPGAWDVSLAVRLAVAATESHVRVPLRTIPDGSPASVSDQVALLREVFENPFRPVVIEEAWLTPTVLTLAHVIQAEQSFDLLPVLGDALQDAGCACAEILEHCYGPGPHVAGCWLIDRLTGWGNE